MRFGVLVIPVEDRSPALDTAPELQHALAHEAYFFRRRAAVALGKANPDDMKGNPNKFHSASVGVRHYDDEETTALSFERIPQLDGQTDSLYLRQDNPGFRRTFDRLPQTFSEVDDKVFTHRVMGGNGTNLLIDGLVAGAALGSARGDMRFDMIGPNHNVVAEFVRDYAERYPGLAEMHEVSGMESRVSYHVSHRILHENRTDTLMISSPPTPEEAIDEALARNAGVIQNSDLFVATDDYARLREKTSDQNEPWQATVGLVPSSNVVKQLALREGQMLLVNDAELIGILQNTRNGLKDIVLPSVLGGDDISFEAGNKTLSSFIHTVSRKKKRHNRIISIGMRGGKNLSLFPGEWGGEACAVEVSLPSDETTENIVHDAHSPYIDITVAEGCGRGDASAAAIVFDDVEFAAFEELCRDEGMDVPHGLSERHKKLASRLISEFAGRFNSTLVHHSLESNFGHLSPDIYRTLLLRYAVQPAMRCAMQLHLQVRKEPQVLECPETGYKAAVWAI